MSYGICKICGCTDHNPCFNYKHGFCWWTTPEHDVCSHCYGGVVPKDDPYTIHCVDGMEFPVLTVHQPYALMLVEGVKETEYRNWKLPEKYVGQRIFIHASKTMDDFDSHYSDKETFYKYMADAYDDELAGMIIGSVVFGKSQGPFPGMLYGSPKPIYKWPVEKPIRLSSPIVVPGKQRIWKIKF